MLDAEWSVEEVAEVSLVEASVYNPTAVDRRVRVENRLDGPALPPRTEGVPEQGWDADGYAGVVPAGERLRLGYASPAPPTEPPVNVEDEGRVDGGTATGDDEKPDAAAALRVLGDASPPADALPAVEGVRSTGEETGASAVTAANADRTGGPERPTDGATDAEVSASVGPQDGEPAAGAGSGDPGNPDRARAEDRTSAEGSIEEAPTDGDSGRRGGENDDTGDGTGGEESEFGHGTDRNRGDTVREADGPDTEVPPPVAEWIADAERRIEHAERLTDASVVEAAAVLDERGGLAAVESLPERVGADEAALRALAERATALADRAAATDVPVAALRRLS